MTFLINHDFKQFYNNFILREILKCIIIITILFRHLNKGRKICYHFSYFDYITRCIFCILCEYFNESIQKNMRRGHLIIYWRIHLH